MDEEDKILACVDQSHYADTVTDAAAWVAGRLNAPLELLHIINHQAQVAAGGDRSGAIGFDAQQHLLETLSEEDANRGRDAREQGRLFLNRLRQRVAQTGQLAPDVRQRHGDLEEVLVEQQPGVRLFVLGRRGESAEATHRDLGRNVERMIRALKKPILAVTEQFQPPRRVLIAFDGGSITRRGVELVAASPLLRDLPVYLLMSGKATRDGAKQLEWARSTLEQAGFDAPAELIPGDAERVIAESVRKLEIDMLIMGAYGHSPIRTLLFGSKTSDLLRSARIPTLLIR
ncbi:universal stress protein [Thiorhodovibrio frisius]|uniref:Universal stress protein UspA-like protein n=1 Tax=Thiorhodovibrio frisius TaxID=631362 RepID=H8Z625_9GAMM|nr:universal stress protein [Thiorhodovibrio frisius]EIC20675.1 universal stress protein UspA-like protein [Thiorhodovibrio frisius]WPL21423.1 Universal stress protein family protein [Thiorhodovibrio frisius]